MKPIDLRSDTVTRPTPAMRSAMASAEVGDDVYGEDPTVNRLEQMAADMLGKERSLFVSSGTQSNLLALLSHCERGDEYIVGQQAHTYKFEGGGGAVLGSIQPQPLEMEPDGSLDLAAVAKAVKPDDFHFARTRLLCLENTHNGKVLPLSYLREAAAFAQDRGLGLHLDGARIFNAAVKLAIPATEITRRFDTISCCLSKGLGAPVGSVLCGPRELIDKARRWRKVLGGGMRQAGVVAAAGIVALRDNVARLAEDHRNARRLAAGLAAVAGVTLDMSLVETNMVFISVSTDHREALRRYLKEREVLISGGDPVRLVTHLDVDGEDIDRVVALFGAYFGGVSAI
jgi:threonine aldolase